MRTIPGKTRVSFTPEEKRLIQHAASTVWGECAYDLLQCVADEKGKSINDVSISRAEVIEIALDAGRAEDLIRDGDLRIKMANASYEQLKRIVRPAFPHARYGL